MKRPPRKIYRFGVVGMLLLALALSAGAPRANAQPQQQRGRSRPKSTAKTQLPDAARTRRAQALALLAETADEARTLADLFYRARLQALAAHALYPSDSPRARILFRRAWEAASASDRAEREETAEQAGTTVDEAEPITEARDEVLAKTAERDTALADAFVRELLKDVPRESSADEGTEAPRELWHAPSALGQRRIALGFKLLGKGEAESAYRIVAPVAREGVSAALLTFMLRLFEQHAPSGEALYRLMIAAALKDATADANTVLLLSTPVVSPELLVAIDEYGSLRYQPVAGATHRALAPLTPATRAAFFNAAASLLLRPAPPRPAVNEAQDHAARYFAIGRLLPFYEREAAQYAPELRARATALLDQFTESRRASLSSQLELRTIGAPPSTDPLRSHFEELARTGEQAERDRITTRIVLVATRNRAWDRARRAAAELGDEDVRRAAESFIAVNQIADLSKAYAEEKEDDYESIVSFLKSVDVPPLAAAWGYAQAAVVAARKKDPQAASALLTEAEHYAERTEANSGERVAAYGAITASAARLDQGRAWEALTQLVKAANALEDYAGDEVSIELRVDQNSPVASETPFRLTAEAFRLDTIFATMSALDFERALTTARALTGPVPRVFAQLAIARAALNKKVMSNE